MHVPSPTSPGRFGFRLVIYSLPQVLQTNGRFYPVVPASLGFETLLTAGSLRSTGITPLLRYYEPLRHPLAGPPISLLGYTVYLAPLISPRDETGFSSGPLCLYRHVVAATPPVCGFRSVRVRIPIRSSPPGQRLDDRISWFSRLPLRSLTLRPDDSLTLLYRAWLVGFTSALSIPRATQARWL